MKDIKVKIYRLKNQKSWTLAYIDPSSEKRIRKRFKTKKEALDFQEGLKYESVTATKVKYSAHTINELMDKYLNLYPGVAKSYFFISYKDIFLNEFGNLHPVKITPTHYRNWLIQTYKDKNWSLKTLIRFKHLFSGFFKFLITIDMIGISPSKKVVILQRNLQINKNKLSQDDMKRILQNLSYMSPYFLYPAIYLMYYGLLERHEVCALKWKNVDFKNHKLHIIQSKLGHVKIVDVPEHLTKYIKCLPKRSEFVLTGRYGKQVNGNTLSSNLSKYRVNYGEEIDFRDSDIKIAGGFHFLENGGSIIELSKRLNHAGIYITKTQFPPPSVKPKEKSIEELIVIRD